MCILKEGGSSQSPKIQRAAEHELTRGLLGSLSAHIRAEERLTYRKHALKEEHTKTPALSSL